MVRIELPGVRYQPQQAPQLSAPQVAGVRDAGNGQAFLRGFDEGAKLGEEFVDQVNDAALKQADNRMADTMRMELQDPEKGYLSTVGQKAVGESRRQAQQRIEAQRLEIEKGLTPAQKSMFANAANRRMQSAYGMMDEHERRQGRVWAMGEAEARAKSLGMDAQTAWGSPDFDVLAGAMLKEVDAWGSLAGVGPDQAEALRRDAESRLFGGVAESLVRQERFEEAKGLLEQKKGRIEEGDRQRVLEMARDGEERAAAVAEKRRVADAGLRLSLEVGGAGILTDQVDEIDARWRDGKITTEERHEAVKLLTDADSREFTASTRERNAALQAAQEWSQQNPQGPRDPNLVGPPASADLRPLPPELAVRLERAGARRAYDLWREGGNQWILRPEGRTAMLTWGDEQLRSFPTKEALVGYLQTRMDPENLGRMVKRWEEAHKPPEQATLGEGEKMRLSKKLAWDYGIVPQKQDRDLSDDEQARQLRWFVALDREVTLTAKGDRKPGYAEYAAAAKSLAAEFFEVDGEKRIVATATPAEIANGRWSGVADGKPWSIDAKVVNVLRADAFASLKAGGYTEDQITERMVAQQAWSINQQQGAAAATAASAAVARQDAERMLVQQFQAALWKTGGDRKAAVTRVLATWEDKMEQLGIDQADARVFLESASNRPDAVREEAWQAEKRRRQDLMGSQWRNRLMPEKWERAMFLGSEEARVQNAASAPNNPQFFYENWHQLDSSLTSGRIDPVRSARRDNPYLQKDYKRSTPSKAEIEQIVREAAR